VKIDETRAPLTYYLAYSACPASRAYFGLKENRLAKPGETVVGAAALGAVAASSGSSRKSGLRAVGIAAAARNAST